MTQPLLGNRLTGGMTSSETVIDDANRVATVLWVSLGERYSCRWRRKKEVPMSK